MSRKGVPLAAYEPDVNKNASSNGDEVVERPARVSRWDDAKKLRAELDRAIDHNAQQEAVVDGLRADVLAARSEAARLRQRLDAILRYRKEAS